MICEICKQRPATVTFTKLNEGEEVSHHYCEECAHIVHMEENNPHPKAISINDILSSWFGTPTWSMNAPTPKEEKEESLVCPSCNMSYKQFLHEGKFHCAHCYESFKEQLPSVFKRLHNGATEHKGKVPGGLTLQYKTKKEIEKLRQSMKSAIEEENFEEAAIVRDKIKLLEVTLEQGGVEKDGI